MFVLRKTFILSLSTGKSETTDGTKKNTNNRLEILFRQLMSLNVYISNKFKLGEDWIPPGRIASKLFQIRDLPLNYLYKG